MTDLEIVCRRNDDGQAWTCEVSIDADGATTHHRVTVAAADLDRLDAGARDPHTLVDASFRFLLEREPPTAILRSFDLPEIGRYFPDFASEIRGRMNAG